MGTAPVEEDFAEQGRQFVESQELPQPAEQLDQPDFVGSDPAVPTAEAARPSKRKRTKWGIALDVFLWALVLGLLLAVLLRLFVFGNITVSGESMTSAYYNTEGSPTYQPELTFHSGDVVSVNKALSPERGDVVVFYKQHVDNKFAAMFASGDDVERGGKYEKLIKRVVALGGDKLWLESVGGGKYKLFILPADSDQPICEDYYTKDGELLSVDAFLLSETDVLWKESRLRGTTESDPYVVKPDCFFALGDNRADSADSRGTLGDVPLDQVYGVVY